ncbi:MAG: response regulator transcription factor [candidate division Zixibacteria bacterium]|nr:response regulator transcription factor [candidate division Zixibacteria bacterium]
MESAKKIMVVEDEKDIGELVLRYLQREGFSASRIGDGRTALARAEAELPDLLILDLMLPGIDGLEIAQRLRRNSRTALIPIIMMTAKGDESDKLLGLEIGADDYIAKPFSVKELVARVKSVLRRIERSEKSRVAYSYGPLALDRSRFEVSIDGAVIDLTTKEFGLLEAFLRNRGRVLTRDYLLSTVWGNVEIGNTRTIDVHVRHLREKIPLLADAVITIKNLGYKLRDNP